jgi:hypothetical protein
LYGFQNNFFKALSATVVKNFKRCHQYRLRFFTAVADSAKKFLAPSPIALKMFSDVATAPKSTKRRFSSLNHQNFEFFRLVPRSPTHTGLICGKTLEPNISSLGPFKPLF